ncbi:MAG: hypothetical protein EOO69_03660 [Moraxellaceae bacterium]|nr:MAG: hypothetical protein EOO69_03660 [Moraxellaceae bacterium]
MQRKLSITLTLLGLLALTGCDKSPQSDKQAEHEQLQTKLPQQTITVKEEGVKKAEEPSAPSMAYEPLYVSDTGVGYDEVFTFSDRGEGLMGQAIDYQSRAGTINIMEQVVDDIEATGYVKVEHAYKFGDKYVLVVSTGENGNSCPATTYVFTYDKKVESVTGKSEIDGCSEMVESFAESNKLIVKKEGKASVIYNGEVK